MNRKWLELRLRKELLGERKVFRDVKEIFGASLSRKGTLNSALVNLKEQVGRGGMRRKSYASYVGTFG